MREPKTVLKLVRNLLEKRSARHREGCFVVEGPHLVEEAGGPGVVEQQCLHSLCKVMLQFQIDQIPLIAARLTLRISAYGVCPAQIKFFGGIQILAGELPRQCKR